MARVKYGQSFWGKYFLDGLGGFYTDEDRLKRGRSYASGNRIFDLKINKNKIKAKAVGNSRPFYNVSLEFPLFDEIEIKKIYEIIDNNPIILGEILNGAIPELFLKLLKKENISLFPQNFYQMQRGCSCPDWGDPCKHMAGVYYVLTKMIDNNPFILFEIRGVDLKKHYKIKDKTIQKPYHITYKKPEGKKEDIYIIRLNDFKDFILSKLPQTQSFSSIDFKKVMEDFYKYSAKNLPFILYPDTNDEKQKLLQEIDISIEMDDDFSYRLNFSHPIVKDIDIDLTKLINLYLGMQTPNTILNNYFYYLSRIAYMIIESSGFIFDLISLEKNYKAILKPLLNTVDIKEQLKLLEKITPPVVKIQGRFIHQQNEVLLSLILNDYLKKLNFPLKKGKGDRIYERVHSMLFAQIPQNKDIEFREIAKAVDNYFDIFNILDSSDSFTLKIEERGDSYFLSFLVNSEPIFKKNDVSIFKIVAKFANSLYKLQDLLTKEDVRLNFDELEKFILEEKETFKDFGIKVILPKELQTLLKPKLKIKAKANGNVVSFLSLNKLLEYDFMIAIGDKEISAKELQELIKKGQKIVKFKEQFVYLDPSEIDTLFKNIQKHKNPNRFELLELSLNDEIELDTNLKEYLKNIFSPKEYPLPNSIKATLREYQKRGFNWGVHNLLNGFGIVLADDMGLGKTLQTIAILSYLKENSIIKKSTLCIVPTSLLNNWANEIEKFSNLSYSFYYGAKREIKKSDIILTTYHTVRNDIEVLSREKFDVIVIDEAQNIKNANTKTTTAIKAIKAKHKIALSGTPVENNLSELWSIFDFSIKGYLKNLSSFRTNYQIPIELKKDIEVANKLKKITSAFMLRRLKSDKSIISDLPQKIVIDELISMEKTQATLYKSYVDEIMAQIKDMEPRDKRGAFFKLLINLKQICNHPKNFDDSYEADFMLSGKSQRLIELLETIISNNEKVLIFTQYTTMGRILEQMIEKTLLIKPLYLTGELSKAKRDKLIKEFEEDESKKIFILSLKAGGVGLNLTKANNVIHYDLWFNPAVENQATDRAFRIGQTKNVNVFRFITKNSFEEKIDKMIKSKLMLQDMTVSSGEKWLGELGFDELERLIR